MRILLLALVLIVSGCSTGVFPIGQDTYMISKQGGAPWSSTGNLKAEVVREATHYCIAEQKKIMPTSLTVIPAAVGRLAEVEYQFMCLSEGDQDLKRPKLQREPDWHEKQTIDININQK